MESLLRRSKRVDGGVDMSKLTSMTEAIARYVPDGASVALGLALEPLIP